MTCKTAEGIVASLPKGCKLPVLPKGYRWDIEEMPGCNTGRLHLFKGNKPVDSVDFKKFATHKERLLASHAYHLWQKYLDPHVIDWAQAMVDEANRRGGQE